ncbi:MAG TPA: hypothetical protein VLX92_00835 [Kofleriaceae bacterium]|nr:hypothetical protein [Kofleriaceae bacterium]
MDSAVATPALDLVIPLVRLNHRLALLRGWLSHDHGDEPYWWARRITAPRAQQEREALRRVAHLIHVARATSRGRRHGTRLASLDEQRAWLAQHEATLARLRAGELPL